jgi:hypothetical protein
MSRDSLRILRNALLLVTAYFVTMYLLLWLVPR